MLEGKKKGGTHGARRPACSFLGAVFFCRFLQRRRLDRNRQVCVTAAAIQVLLIFSLSSSVS